MGSFVSLPGDVRMPRLGLGTYRSPAGAEVEHAVDHAIRVGYRHIDTASLYGNEESIGAAIRASGVPREELFVTTKLWNDDQGRESAKRALGRSLKLLGFEYVDLYLVHWPIREKLADTWQGMQDLLASGLTRAIGVCNFLPHHLEALLGSAEVMPAVDQVEFHPRLQQPDLQVFLAEHDIVLEAWAPIMRGHVDDVPELQLIAQRHGVTPAQVAIRWELQLGVVTIPKSVHDARIDANADVFDFALSDAEMSAIDALDTGGRIGPDPNVYAW
jgi:diketogulonate reductase-like aldo/keto reductase